MPIYEFEITRLKSQTYECIEAETLEAAEQKLERKHEVTDGSAYELYDVFHHFERRVEIAQEWERELLTRLSAGETAILETNIQSICDNGYAVVVDQENDTIRVYPTLDLEFKKEK